MNRRMNRLGARRAQVLFVLPLMALLAACPGDKKPAPAQTAQVDTTPVNLDSLQTAIPPAAPDTFKPIPKPVVRQPRVAQLPPNAPPALMEVVSRQQSFTRFCYQEFGQKADPTLAGGVSVVVTVGSAGVTAASVAADSWTSSAGKAVNRCINERAAQAWKLEPGVVRAGRYLVPLRFAPA
ncbi:MAG TPA: hypothetical protein VJ672_00095 [Gemmatimonadaceae bacterium]|nr:hypothetical protein [Gemmatimonadaceae bacterium]